MARSVRLVIAACVVVVPTAALADPVSIGAATLGLLGPIGGALTAAGVTAGFVGNVILGGAAIAGSILLGGRRRRAPSSEDLTQKKEGQEGPGQFAFGRCEVEGVSCFGSTLDKVLYRVDLFAFGPLNEVEEYYYDGQPVAVSGQGQVTSPPYFDTSVPSKFSLNISTKVGDGTETAWAALTAAFPDLWTSDHKIQGIAQALVTLLHPGIATEDGQKLLVGGMKNVRIRGRFGSFYDPRLGSLTDPVSTTHQWTRNAALIVLHYMRELPTTKDDEFDFADIALTATACEQLVTTKTGETVLRAALSGGGQGVVTVDVVLDMMRSAGLEARRTAAGLRTLRLIEDYPAAELVLPERSIVELTEDFGPEGVSRPNVCRVKYLAPERQYTVTEIDMTGVGWAWVTDEVNAVGEQEMEITLPFCPNSNQAQRIARQLFLMARARAGAARTTFAGLAAWWVGTLDLPIPEMQSDGSAVIARVRNEALAVDDANGQCELTYRVVPDELQTPFNPATDEADAPEVMPIVTVAGDVETPPAPTSAAQSFEGGVQAVRVQWDPVSGAVSAEANYRLYENGEPTGWVSMDVDFGNDDATGDGDFTGRRMDFRFRVFDSNGDASQFSPLLRVTSLA